jgi:hypothetical protein
MLPGYTLTMTSQQEKSGSRVSPTTTMRAVTASVWVLFDGPDFRGVCADRDVAEPAAEVVREQYRAESRVNYHVELHPVPVRTSPRWGTGTEETASGLPSLAWAEDLVAIAQEHGRSQVGLIQWMCAPNGYLDGDRPIDHIDDLGIVLGPARNAFGVSW